MTEKPETENRGNDKAGEYLVHHLDHMLFDELSDEYLDKAGIKDILKGVPVPFKAEDITSGGTSTLSIASNMAFVIGADSGFKYRDKYIEYILKFFPHDFEKALINEGIKAAEDKEPEIACIYFRAAKILAPDSIDAKFLYGRACKDAYESGDGEDYIGTFKAEALKTFERVTIEHPDFDQAYYFLGFAYLNLGLYMKSKLTFDEFMKLSKDTNLRNEVKEVVEGLKDPIKIESGINSILSGRASQGIEELSPYLKDPRFSSYWPMWYYTGVALRDLGEPEEAKEKFLEALKVSPSNIDVMKELIGIYEEEGDEEKIKKYREKIALVENNMELDKEEKAKGLS